MIQAQKSSLQPRNPRRPLRSLQLLRQRYRVGTLIAQDGFGAVYKAHDTLLDLPVALKVALRQEQECDEVAMLHEEARCLAQLHHPGIPGYVDFFEEHGQWVLVMQLIEGGRISTRQPLSVRQVVLVGMQICEILVYLHRRSLPVVHRDIKPSNILVAGTQFFLVDFGLSCHPGNCPFLCGSPYFAAPEQLTTGVITPKVDIYGLGQTLRFLLTGQLPANPPEEANVVVPFPSTLQSQSDQGLLSLCAAMTENCPEDRPETEAVWRELSAIYREVAQQTR